MYQCDVELYLASVNIIDACRYKYSVQKIIAMNIPSFLTSWLSIRMFFSISSYLLL
jgi:hypothetical protein